MRERKKPRISWVTKTKWILRMEKLKNAISKALAWLNKAYQWLDKEGGMLHLLACYAMMLTLEPFVGWVLASVIAWIIFLGEEAIDYFIRKSNNLKQVLNDIIRDAIGWGCASVVWLITTM
jgi:hypothetical protein